MNFRKRLHNRNKRREPTRLSGKCRYITALTGGDWARHQDEQRLTMGRSLNFYPCSFYSGNGIGMRPAAFFYKSIGLA